MVRMRSYTSAAFVSVAIACLVVNAQGPEGSVPDSPATEKSVLTETSQQPKTDDAAAEYCQCVRGGDSAAAEKIEKVLAGPLHSSGIDYVDQPLMDVVNNLQDEYRIPITVNRPALEEVGLAIDHPVSITFHNLSVRSALKLMLEQLQLTWVVRDEVLMITTPDDANSILETCVYNVHGLVDDGDPQSMNALIEAIQDSVAFETWAVHGDGQATIKPLPPGLVVISQTPQVHEQIGGLLAKIRTMREKVPAPKTRPKQSEPAPAHSSR